MSGKKLIGYVKGIHHKMKKFVRFILVFEELEKGDINKLENARICEFIVSSFDVNFCYTFYVRDQQCSTYLRVE